MLKTDPIRSKKPSEEGYMLVAVIFMLALVILALSVALPKVKDDIQVDRERETMHRGLQYARGIKLYYKKFHAYPPSVDALVQTNNIRFLRKKYTDPMTGKDDWKPIMFGQNKTPMAMGFFGQPLAGVGSVLAGTGPGGNNGIAGAGGLNGTSGGFGSGFGGAAGGTFGGSSGSLGSGGTQTGSNNGSLFGTDNSGNNGTGNSGTNPGTGNGTDSGNGSSNPTFGGGGIIGFSPGSDKPSILVYKKKTRYNEWEFLYSPLAERMMLQGGGNAGTIGQPTTPTNGGFGNGSGITGGPQPGGNGNIFSPGSGTGTGQGSPTTPQQ